MGRKKLSLVGDNKKKRSKLLIQEVPIKKLNPAKYNPRLDLKPGDKEYHFIEKSLDEFGNVDPIVWNKRTGNIVGGHQRFKILSSGLSSEDKLEVSVVDLDERKEKKLNIALNKISGDWNFPLLKSLIEDIDLEDFELDQIGFEMEEIKKMFAEVEENARQEEEANEEDIVDNYAPQYGVIVICNNESHQEEVYDFLLSNGYKCKVVNT